MNRPFCLYEYHMLNAMDYIGSTKVQAWGLQTT